MADAVYQLYYWPMLPGRGEFVRLTLEQAGAAYEDVGREQGAKAIVELLRAPGPGTRPLAPPVLVDGDLRLAQVAAILDYLGAKHELAPRDPAGRSLALQLQLTVADLVAEAHDTHHPVAKAQYYEDQKPEALRYAQAFVDSRMGKFLSYFEAVLAASGGPFVFGEALSYVDLSLGQVMRGLEYAFPKAFARVSANTPKLVDLRQRVDALPRISAYRASERCIDFNEDGIFRRYPELDLEPSS